MTGIIAGRDILRIYSVVVVMVGLVKVVVWQVVVWRVGVITGMLMSYGQGV